MKNILLVVDMQVDFIDGSLGTQEAVKILPNVRSKIENFEGTVVFTRDTHFENYLDTQEGKNLPVKHCIQGTKGWQIHPQIADLATEHIYDKNSFGGKELPEFIEKINEDKEDLSIMLVGLCTDICVISNAMILKAFFPEATLTVDASCCAGVTVESHNNALEAMKMCQIQVENV